MYNTKMRHSILFRAIVVSLAFLLLLNDLSWADPSDFYEAHKTETLAAQSVFSPFLKDIGMDFRSMALVMYAAGDLRDRIAAGDLRQSHIVQLNRLFADGTVEIDPDLRSGSLSSSGRAFRYAVFSYKTGGGRRTFHAVYLRDRGNLTPAESAELGAPAMDGVWFAADIHAIKQDSPWIDMSYRYLARRVWRYIEFRTSDDQYFPGDPPAGASLCYTWVLLDQDDKIIAAGRGPTPSYIKDEEAYNNRASHPIRVIGWGMKEDDVFAYEKLASEYMDWYYSRLATLTKHIKPEHMAAFKSVMDDYMGLAGIEGDIGYEERTEQIRALYDKHLRSLNNPAYPLVLAGLLFNDDNYDDSIYFNLVVARILEGYESGGEVPARLPELYKEAISKYYLNELHRKAVGSAVDLSLEPFDTKSEPPNMAIAEDGDGYGATADASFANDDEVYNVKVGDNRLADRLYWVIKPAKAAADNKKFVLCLRKVNELELEYRPGQYVYYDLFLAPLDKAGRWETLPGLLNDYKEYAKLSFDGDGRLIRPSKGWFVSTHLSVKNKYPWLHEAVRARLEAMVGEYFVSANSKLQTDRKSAIADESSYVEADISQTASEAYLRPEDRPHVSQYEVNGKRCVIHWKNPDRDKRHIFAGDREVVLEHFRSFQADRSKVEGLMRELGRPISYDDISGFEVNFMRTSQRAVFKIRTILKGSVTSRAGPEVVSKLFMAAKESRTSSTKQADAFRKLKGTGLAPEFGGSFDDFYYEEWIDGITVLSVGKRRPLTDEELRSIAWTWTRIGVLLSPAGTYRNFPSDMNSANIMYKKSESEPDFAVVDIYGRDDKPVSPAIFVAELVKFYNGGTGIIKAAHPQDISPILEGIYDGFGDDKESAIDFLRKAAKGLLFNNRPLISQQITAFVDAQKSPKTIMGAESSLLKSGSPNMETSEVEEWNALAEAIEELERALPPSREARADMPLNLGGEKLLPPDQMVPLYRACLEKFNRIAKWYRGARAGLRADQREEVRIVARTFDAFISHLDEHRAELGETGRDRLVSVAINIASSLRYMDDYAASIGLLAAVRPFLPGKEHSMTLALYWQNLFLSRYSAVKHPAILKYTSDLWNMLDIAPPDYVAYPVIENMQGLVSESRKVLPYDDRFWEEAYEKIVPYVERLPDNPKFTGDPRNEVLRKKLLTMLTDLSHVYGQADLGKRCLRCKELKIALLSIPFRAPDAAPGSLRVQAKSESPNIGPDEDGADFLDFDNVSEQMFVKRYAEYIKKAQGKAALDAAQVEEMEKFEYVIKELYDLKDEVRVFPGFPNDCCEFASRKAFDLLDRNGFDVRLAMRNFVGLDRYPALHYYVIVKLAGEEFILDLVADQFFPYLGTNMVTTEYPDLGVLLMPKALAESETMSELCWMYTTGKLFEEREGMYRGDSAKTGNSVKMEGLASGVPEEAIVASDEALGDVVHVGFLNLTYKEASAISAALSRVEFERTMGEKVGESDLTAFLGTDKWKYSVRNKSVMALVKDGRIKAFIYITLWEDGRVAQIEFICSEKDGISGKGTFLATAAMDEMRRNGVRSACLVVSHDIEKNTEYYRYLLERLKSSGLISGFSEVYGDLGYTNKGFKMKLAPPDAASRPVARRIIPGMHHLATTFEFHNLIDKAEVKSESPDIELMPAPRLFFTLLKSGPKSMQDLMGASGLKKETFLTDMRVLVLGGVVKLDKKTLNYSLRNDFSAGQLATIDAILATRYVTGRVKENLRGEGMEKTARMLWHVASVPLLKRQANAATYYRIFAPRGTIPRPPDTYNRTGLNILGELLESPGRFSELLKKQEVPDLRGVELGVTSNQGIISIPVAPNYRYSFSGLGRREGGWHAVIADCRITGPVYELTIEFSKKGAATESRVFQIGYSRRVVPGINREKGKNRTMLDMDYSAGRTALCRLIYPTVALPELKDKGLPDMRWLRLGETDSNGIIYLSPKEGFIYPWYALGFPDKGWSGVIVRSGSVGGVFEFQVQFTKPGKKPVKRTFQIDRFTRSIKGRYDMRGTAISVREIGDNFGFDVIGRVMRRLSARGAYKWPGGAVPDIAGLRFGLTDKDGHIRFNPVANYSYNWSVLGFREAGWEIRGWKSEVINGYYTFIVDLIKGDKRFKRTFQIGPYTADLIPETGNPDRRKAEAAKIVDVDRAKKRAALEELRSGSASGYDESGIVPVTGGSEMYDEMDSKHMWAAVERAFKKIGAADTMIAQRIVEGDLDRDIIAECGCLAGRLAEIKEIFREELAPLWAEFSAVSVISNSAAPRVPGKSDVSDVASGSLRVQAKSEPPNAETDESYAKDIKLAPEFSEEARNVEAVVLSGPSGAGKSTFFYRFCEKYGRYIYKPPLTTTRKPRDREEEGVDYNFVSEKEFIDMDKAGEMLFSRKASGVYYGTAVRHLPKIADESRSGKVIMLETNNPGAIRKMKEFFRSARVLTVLNDEPGNFSDPGRRAELERDLSDRLRGRSTMSNEELAIRVRESIDYAPEIISVSDEVAVNRTGADHPAEYEKFEKFMLAMLAKAEADRIHAANLALTPTVPDKTIICHIIADSILPAEQRSVLNKLEIATRPRKFNEKILWLKMGGDKDFVRQVNEAMDRARKAYAREYGKEFEDYTLKFDVACPSVDLVAKISGDTGMKALAFESSDTGNVVQIEAIVLALRAVQSGDMAALIRAYTAITGEEFAPDGDDDISTVARKIIFRLPATNVNDYEDINDFISAKVVDSMA